MKVVFDSNIYVSAFAIPGGKAEKAIHKALSTNDDLFVSKEILDEILTVLSRKFARDREFLSRTAIFISEIAEMVEPSIKVKVLKDEPDNRIIECALEAGADIIVTGDKEMLRLRRYRGIRIIGLKEYVE